MHVRDLRHAVILPFSCLFRNQLNVYTRARMFVCVCVRVCMSVLCVCVCVTLILKTAIMHRIGLRIPYASVWIHPVPRISLRTLSDRHQPVDINDWFSSDGNVSNAYQQCNKRRWYNELIKYYSTSLCITPWPFLSRLALMIIWRYPILSHNPG